MSLLNGSKLNQLLNNWPRGAVYASSWLHEQGFGYDLLRRYRKSNWIYSVGDNAIARSGDKVDWKGAVYAMQKQLRLPIHVGGKTALDLLGYSHYVALKQRPLTLYSPRKVKLPAWFKKYDWGAPTQFIATNLFSTEEGLGLQEHQDGELSIQVSSPERAMMEVLYLVPQEQSFDESKYLMENLATLRPTLILTLLKNCHSIKVKRLFMFLAEECNHSWVKKLNLSGIDFGKGNRMIVQEGYLNPKYKITVPKEFKVQATRNEDEK